MISLLYIVLIFITLFFTLPFLVITIGSIISGTFYMFIIGTCLFLFALFSDILILKKIKRIKNPDNAKKLYQMKDETEDHVFYDSLKLATESMNVETALERIQLLEGRFDSNKLNNALTSINNIEDESILNNIEKLQINAIKRCYEKTVEESKTLKTEKAQINRIYKFFEVTHKFEHSLSDKVKNYILYLENYRTDELPTGNTVVEQWNEGYRTAKSKKEGIDAQEEIELSNDEIEFIKELNCALVKLGIDYKIRYDRKSNGTLNFTYHAMQFGRLKLRGRKTSMQILYPDSSEYTNGVKNIENIDLEGAKSHIREWINYLEHLNNDRDKFD